MVLGGMEPTTGLVFQALLLLSLVVLVVAVADLVLRGRFRNAAIALTGMLTLLGPLLGVYAAANALMVAFIEVADTNTANFPFVAPALAEAALAVAIGALVGAGAVILKTVLKLVDARRSRTT